MCGIAGILDRVGEAIDHADLRRLAAALSHRGPDGEGIWICPEGNAGFVHRRLAILDTSAQALQPMHSADGRYTIVYNGEIFNFLELRRELEDAGHVFITESDTEVILGAWRLWREGMLSRFNGMWAFALRDNVNGEVFFARDRFGIKPLLYCWSGRRLAFASEMRALRELGRAGEIDSEVACRIVFDPFGVEASERSLFAGIRRLPAGHLAKWKDGRFVVERWWRTSENLVEIPIRFEDQADRFRDLFMSAVKLRMRSDVRVGTCLSGGFDSSAIVCAMAEVALQGGAHERETDDWRHAFIAGFPGLSNDETASALTAAAWARVAPHVFDLTRLDGLATLQRVLSSLDDVYLGLPVAPWRIYEELRTHGTLVSLDGHGADELMGGYKQAGQGLAFYLRNWVDSISQSLSVASQFAEGGEGRLAQVPGCLLSPYSATTRADCASASSRR